MAMAALDNGVLGIRANSPGEISVDMAQVSLDRPRFPTSGASYSRVFGPNDWNDLFSCHNEMP